MKGFLIALQFLTALPIKIKTKIKDRDFSKSLLYFPLIGLLIGLLLSAVAVLFSFLPNLVTGVLILITSIIITGGIHLDGFADTCDGFYGSRPKEKILEIMRDSRIGVMGVTGIVVLLLLKFTIIVSIPQDILWKSLIMMAVFARWSQSYACYSSKSAREDGKAKLFIEYAGPKETVIGELFTLVLFLLLAGLRGLMLFVLAFILIFLFNAYARRKIGGMTGDTIGATSEIAETGILFLSLLFF